MTDDLAGKPCIATACQSVANRPPRYSRAGTTRLIIGFNAELTGRGLSGKFLQNYNISCNIEITESLDAEYFSILF